MTEEIIRDFFTENLHYSQSCISKMYQQLNTVLKEAIKLKIILLNPMEEIKCPQSDQELIPVRALTIEELKALVDILLSEDIQYSDIMLLSLFTGMRIGECCALSVNDVNLPDKTIFIHRTVSRGTHGKTVISKLPKNKRKRLIPIDDDIVELLKGCIGTRRQGLIFLSSNDKIITTNQVNSVYSGVLDNNHIIDDTIYGKVDLHSLRHTYATRCIEAGMPAKVLQKLLGHSNISITLDIYCDVFDRFQDEHMKKAQQYMKQLGLAISCHIGCQT